MAQQITLIVVQPLWFVGLYALVIALTPITLAMHQRLGLVPLLVLIVATMIVDLLRLGFHASTFGYVNYVAV